ncbi:helix-turn-helix domain-containing protein [Streptomyces sp. NBC_00161]|uniref:helix-turn-helix domain-containing protein n=1 Tax=Streptomyces sp. NBC_00161 TaxID=2975671 RepID=UPI003250F6DD
MKSTPSTHPQQSGELAGRTDLGRRLAARREALGLSREELGRRCGADGTYIAYLEEHAARPAIGTLVRVADTLGLTVDDLTGASAHRVAGRSTALMLGYLFRPAELEQMFLRLGHRLDDGLWRRTVDYYLRRTCHGSTLSSLVHGWILAREQGPDAWRYCQEALLSDITDVQGGTTGEGIHLGAMGGTLDLVERGIVGLEPHGDGLHIDLVPLSEVPGSSFAISYLGHRDIRIRFRPGRLGISVPSSLLGPVPLVLPGDRQERIAAGQERWFLLPKG